MTNQLIAKCKEYINDYTSLLETDGSEDAVGRRDTGLLWLQIGSELEQVYDIIESSKRPSKPLTGGAAAKDGRANVSIAIWTRS